MNPVLFWAMAALVLVGAVMVVRLGNLFHAGLSLVVTFMGVAGLYAMLEAHFLTAVQLLIYIGAITVILVFAVMLTHHIYEREAPIPIGRDIGVTVACVLFASAGIYAVWHQNWATLSAGQPFRYVTPNQLGMEFIDKSRFLLPFELVGVLLLVTLVGAVMVAWREKQP